MTSMLPDVGFGMSRVASLGVSKSRSEENLTAAWDAGIRHYDTSSSYSQGGSERMLAKLISSRRDEAFVATKAGYIFSETGSGLEKIKRFAGAILKGVKRQLGTRSSQFGPARQDFSLDYLFRTLAGSTRRLGIEQVNIFYLHSPPPELASSPAFEDTLAALKDSGLAGRVGVSCRTTSDAAAFVGKAGVEALQVPITPDTVPDYLIWHEQAVQSGTLVIARDIFRETENLRASRALYRLSKNIGADPYTARMHLVRSLPGVSSVIFSASTPKRITENYRILASNPPAIDICLFSKEVLSDC